MIYKKIQIGKKVFFVEIVNDLVGWTKGLSGREKMKRSQGMLFVYPTMSFKSFWPKDMTFGLDIVCFDSDLKVNGFIKNMLPSEKPTSIRTSHPIQAALEICQGESEGISEGDQLLLIKDIKGK